MYHSVSCDHVKLQNYPNKLFEWSVRNLMHFRPGKCKVIAVTNKKMIYHLPFYEFWYTFNDKHLDYVRSEKDLGVIIDSKLLWTLQCEMLVKKATKQFNLLRRTCYFISDSNQRRVFYLSLILVTSLNIAVKSGPLKTPHH